MTDYWKAVRQVATAWQERIARSMGFMRGLNIASLSPWRSSYSTPWPPPQDRFRLQRYSRFWQIYEAEHEEVYVTHGKYKYDQSRPFLPINLCGEITDLLADRLFGEDLGIAAPEGDDATDEFIAHLGATSGLENLWVDMATEISPRGDGILKVRFDADAQDIRIEYVSPSLYFFTDDDEPRPMLAWLLWGGDGKPYLFQEIHGAGSIENRLYELHGDLAGGDYGFTEEKDRKELATIPALEVLPDEQATGVDAPLLVHIALGGGSRQWGRSDYADIEHLQGELDNRATQRAEILDKHAYPKLAGPRLYVDESGQVATLDDYIQTESEGQIPQYITWDAQLTAVENEIRDLKADMMLTAGVSPASLQLDEGGAAESGRALKLREHRTASAVRRRQKTYGPAIRAVISLATKLYNSPEAAVAWSPESGEVTSLNPEDVTLTWQDGLPSDRTEEIENQALMMASGLTTKRRAMQELHGLTDDEIDAILGQGSTDDRKAERRVQFAPPPEPVAPEQEIKAGGGENV